MSLAGDGVIASFVIGVALGFVGALSHSLVLTSIRARLKAIEHILSTRD